MNNEEEMNKLHNRILIVDDSSANLQLLMHLLTEQGYTVHPASSGELALRFIASTLPDLILLDIKMPGMGGFEVCRRLKADEKTSSIPIIFISVLGNQRAKVKGFQAGGVDFVTKPFQPEEVLARVKTHLDLRALTLQLEQEVNKRTEELIAINQQLQQELTERKQREREREVIITVSNAMRQATTRTEIINMILDQLIDLFDATGSILILPDIRAEGLIIEMGRGIVGEKMIGLNIPPGKGISNWVITNKEPYLTNHADQDPLFYLPELLGNSLCVASVPLIAQEEAIGALGIVRRMDFVEQDLRLLTAIADIAANAIQRVTLHEQTEQQLHRLSALHQIDLAISTHFDLDIMLDIILKHVKEELDVNAVSILLLNPVTHTLDYATGIGFRTNNIEQSQVRIGHGCAGRAVQEKRTVSCLDLLNAPEKLSRSSFLAGEKFDTHYTTPLIIKGQVKGVLELFHRSTLDPEHTWLSYFETLATQTAVAIENASLFENLQQSNEELTLAYDATIEGWSHALDLRDEVTEGHTLRVTKLALELAEKVGMSEKDRADLRRGALLHDIGKMGIPDTILRKPGPLTEAEEEIMRKHPTYAYQMLSSIKYLDRALEIPYCHHERWDGSGYPRGLKGEEIPLSARIFAVVDVFDALTSDRPYRKAWAREKAYHYIREQSGKHFDPKVAKIFLERENTSPELDGAASNGQPANSPSC